MPKARNVQVLMIQAEEKEKNYSWNLAVDFYRKAASLALRKQQFKEAGDIHLRIGYCLFRSAFQAETKEDFKRRMRRAGDSYTKGADLFRKSGETTSRAEINDCKAMSAYIDSWLAPNSREKRRQFQECWRLEQETLNLAERSADKFSVGKTCNNLMMFLASLLTIEWDAKSREKIIDEALEYGENAVEIFSTTEEKSDLAKAYTLASFFHRHAAFARGFKADKREESRKKALAYPGKAIEISETLGDAYLLGEASLHLAYANRDIRVSTGLTEIQHLEKALKCGRLVKDNLLIGDALYGLEFSKHWRVVSTEEPGAARQEYKKLREYGEEAIRHYSIISYNAGISMAYTMMLFSVEELYEMETTLQKKLKFTEKSVGIGYKGLEHARISDSMDAITLVNSALGTALVCRARVESDSNNKTDLLRKAMKHIEESINIQKEATALANLEPIEGNLALAHWSLALSQLELAKTEESTDGRTGMLKNAIKNMRITLDYWQIWSESPWTRPERPHLSFEGMVQQKSGKTLRLLYEITNDTTFLKSSIEAFRRSVDVNNKANMPSRVAEAYWQIARNHSSLSEHSESTENFESASYYYAFAAEKTPQLASFYQDHATYMKAWSEIEKARRSHIQENFLEARAHYEKAAKLHESTKRWNYLGHIYNALARLEKGAEFTRREQAEEARDSFRQATKIFAEAKRAIDTRLARSDDEDERAALDDTSTACDIRLEYSLGRLALEEARILDREGKNTISSQKYSLAAETFEKLVSEVRSDPEKRELRFISYLCRGWQKMALAEAEASSELYAEASKFFDEAKNHSSNEKARRLALGHSRFAQALEEGTIFEDTRDLKLYSIATRHLESAANHYMKAGFRTASEYVKATQRLFDAYVYVDEAKKELDPEKKTKYYLMAEKVLQTSAKSYLKANQLEKSQEIKKLLGRIKEERELAILLSDVLRMPSSVSTAAPFSTPTLTQENAVGLERLDHADIQANLIPSSLEAKIEDNISLKMEIANAGKAAASLVKAERIIPEHFELVEGPVTYHAQNSHLDFKGKRLPALDTEEIKLVLRPTAMGTFILNPRILYVDENGKNRFCEPDPARIRVSEAPSSRITTGYHELDDLLFGGIPRNYSILLTSPSNDERDLLIRKFIEAGIREGQVTFYVTTKVSDLKALAEEFQSSFFLFSCNPQADSFIPDLPNVFKLNGVQNLTDISISLAWAFRKMPKQEGPKRACIEIVSDVLLQHKAIQTRRWLNALIPELKSKGFTILAVLDPPMHPPQDVRAVTDLFDGEFNIYEKE
ncbi:MAG: hypothetical protein JSW29_00725, partial [Candidatus Bathyarchaeota archaeon]